MSGIYESPDGTKCLEKTADTSLTALKLGSFWAAYEMVGRSKPATIGAIATRYVYWVAPAVAMGASFAAVGCVMGSIREKDDYLNHIVAGASTAAIIGTRYGPKHGFLWAFLLGASAGLNKCIRDNGVNILELRKTPAKDFGSFHHYDHHFGPRREVKEPTNY